jgi:hypothetical protein
MIGYNNNNFHIIAMRMTTLKHDIKINTMNNVHSSRLFEGREIDKGSIGIEFRIT